MKKKYVSNVCVACNNIWVSTVGAGLWVVDPSLKQVIAVWGETEKQQVFKLLHVEDSNMILALTRQGMYVFSAILGQVNPASPISCDVLIPVSSNPRSGNDINEGVVIPADGNLDRCEVWVCSQNGHSFQVLDSQMFDVLEEVSMLNDGEHKGRKIRHMCPFLLEGRSTLAVADRHFLQRWDVEERMKKKDFNCFEACKDMFGEHGTFYIILARVQLYLMTFSLLFVVRKSRVTSLLADADVIYVGTGGGAILVLGSMTMEMTHVLYAYSNPVRCLLSVSPGTQVKSFMRMFSRKESGGSVTPSSISMRRGSAEDSTGSLASKYHHKSSASSIDETLPQDRKILLSFGMGYRGIVGSSPNHPHTFILPSDSTASGGYVASSSPRVAKPSSTVVHLLLWSAETTPSAQKSAPGFDEIEEEQF